MQRARRCVCVSLSSSRSLLVSLSSPVDPAAVRRCVLCLTPIIFLSFSFFLSLSLSLSHWRSQQGSSGGSSGTRESLWRLADSRMLSLVCVCVCMCVCSPCSLARSHDVPISIRFHVCV